MRRAAPRNLPTGDKSTAYRGYYIAHAPHLDRFEVQKDGHRISSPRSLEEAKKQIDELVGEPAAPARAPRPAPAPAPSGKVSSAILETLQSIEQKQERILEQLERRKAARPAKVRRNMYGETVPDEEE